MMEVLEAQKEMAESSFNDSSVHSESETGRSCSRRPESAKDNHQIAAKESMAVFWSRILFMLLLVLLAIGTALAAYFAMVYAEQQKFRAKFLADSMKILESIGLTLDRSFGSIDAFAVNTVSIARDTNQTWPFVTIPDFALRSAKVLSLAKGIWFTNYIYVTHDQREKWQQYSLQNDDWVDQALYIQEKALNSTYFGPIIKEWKPYGVIHSFEAKSVPDAPFYFPQWQTVRLGINSEANARYSRVSNSHCSLLPPTIPLPANIENHTGYNSRD
jgi:hypothetical protein